MKGIQERQGITPSRLDKEIPMSNQRAVLTKQPIEHERMLDGQLQQRRQRNVHQL
jgi:hypothetical protein